MPGPVPGPAHQQRRVPSAMVVAFLNHQTQSINVVFQTQGHASKVTVKFQMRNNIIGETRRAVILNLGVSTNNAGKTLVGLSKEGCQE